MEERAVGRPVGSGEVRGVDFELETVVDAVGERRAKHLLGREREAVGVGQRR